MGPCAAAFILALMNAYFLSFPVNSPPLVFWDHDQLHNPLNDFSQFLLASGDEVLAFLFVFFQPSLELRFRFGAGLGQPVEDLRQLDRVKVIEIGFDLVVAGPRHRDAIRHVRSLIKASACRTRTGEGSVHQWMQAASTHFRSGEKPRPTG